MRRLAVPAVIMLLSLTPVGAMLFPENVAQWKDALATRVATINAFPSPTAGEIKEAKGLAKALAVLGAYADGRSDKQLAIVGKALGTAYRTNTADPTIRSRAATLVGGFDSLAGDVKSRTDSFAAMVLNPSEQGKVQTAIDRAQAVRAGYGAEPDWGRAAKILLKAISGFGRAESSAGKYVEEQNLSFPVLQCIVEGQPYFSADPTSVKAIRTGDLELVISGEMPGDPGYSVVLGVDDFPVPGFYSLDDSLTFYEKTIGGIGTQWFRTTGVIAIEYVGLHTVSGTFAFVAEGAITLSQGRFRAPVR